jgi:hypothetical protein
MLRNKFRKRQVAVVNQASGMAEELVSIHYKMSASQWLRPKYDVRTLAELAPEEIIDGPFAQIIRYKGQPRDASLGSSTYDFYKICLQDHAVLGALQQHSGLRLLPFTLYIVTHELIHIVRFSKFLQGFDASPAERLEEEKRVHTVTNEILAARRIEGLPAVLAFFDDWRRVYDCID